MRTPSKRRSRGKTVAERINGLRWRLRATKRIWRPSAEPEMPVLEPAPAESVTVGRLDVPPGGLVVARDMASFGGWTVLPSGRAMTVEMWLGERPLGRARLGLARPDVCAALALPLAAATGFELTVDLTDWSPEVGETSLRGLATGANGERLELGPVPVRFATEAVGPKVLTAPSRHVAQPSRGHGLRTLVFTHELGLGGAQLYLMDLLGELLRIEAIDPVVVSALDGGLRVELEATGVPVHISGPPPNDSLSAHLGRVEELAAWAVGGDFEVALVNTATSLALPGVEVAARLDIPALWSIHESYPLSLLWANLHPAVRRRAEAALGSVALTLFVAESTQRLFEPAIRPERSFAVPYGLDLTPIDSRRDGFDREAVRREAGVPADADVALCVGSIEPRKGQVPLAQAFDLVADRHPRAHLVYVGGRDDDDSRFLAEHAEASRVADRIVIVPMTADVQPWFGLSDLVVCASDIESMPRTVLEAMAWERPVLATSVFGLPELIEDGVNGWLCEPRDIEALARGLDRAFGSSPEERWRIGLAGRSLVEHRHSLEGYGRGVARLLRQLADGSRSPALADAASA